MPHGRGAATSGQHQSLRGSPAVPESWVSPLAVAFSLWAPVALPLLSCRCCWISKRKDWCSSLLKSSCNSNDLVSALLSPPRRYSCDLKLPRAITEKKNNKTTKSHLILWQIAGHLLTRSEEKSYILLVYSYRMSVARGAAWHSVARALSSCSDPAARLPRETGGPKQHRVNPSGLCKGCIHGQIPPHFAVTFLYFSGGRVMFLDCWEF